MTTDGGFKRQLELPATGVERSYRARAYGEVTQAQLEALSEGIEIDGIRYGSIDANLERRTGANMWIELTLTEGKNREVRRVLEHLGLQVSRLIRVRYGPFLLDDLPVGGIGEVRQHELVAFRKTLKGGIPVEVTVPAARPGFRTPASGDRPVKTAGDRRPASGRPARARPAAPEKGAKGPGQAVAGRKAPLRGSGVATASVERSRRAAPASPRAAAPDREREQRPSRGPAVDKSGRIDRGDRSDAERVGGRQPKDRAELGGTGKRPGQPPAGAGGSARPRPSPGGGSGPRGPRRGRR